MGIFRSSSTADTASSGGGFFRRYSSAGTTDSSGGRHFGLDGYVGGTISELAADLPFEVKLSGNLSIDDCNAMAGHAELMKEQSKFWGRYSKDAAIALEHYQMVRKYQGDTALATLEARDKIIAIDSKVGQAYNKSEGLYGKTEAEYRQAMELQYRQNQHAIEMATRRGANDKRLQADRFSNDRRMEDDRFKAARSRISETFNQRLQAMKQGQSQVFAPIKSRVTV